jgi:hypothetical protein
VVNVGVVSSEVRSSNAIAGVFHQTRLAAMCCAPPLRTSTGVARVPRRVHLALTGMPRAWQPATQRCVSSSLGGGGRFEVEGRSRLGRVLQSCCGRGLAAHPCPSLIIGSLGLPILPPRPDLKLPVKAPR